MSIVESALIKSRARIQENSGIHGMAGGASTSVAQPTADASPEGHAPFYLSLGSGVVPIDIMSLQARGLLASGESVEMTEEQFQRLKRPLLEHAVGRHARGTPRGRVIMLASSLSGEGKTFCSLNLALTIAKEVDLDVLLIDADIRKADLTRAFKLEDAPGLAELSADPGLALENVARRTSVERLSFLPSGQMVSGIPELWSSARMDALVQRLATLSERTVVVIDSSPILLTSEAQVLSRLVGQVVLVVRADSTLQSAVTEAISLLDPERRLACLLNCTAQANPGGYKYGYPYVERGSGKPESKP